MFGMAAAPPVNHGKIQERRPGPSFGGWRDEDAETVE